MAGPNGGPERAAQLQYSTGSIPQGNREVLKAGPSSKAGRQQSKGRTWLSSVQPISSRMCSPGLRRLPRLNCRPASAAARVACKRQWWTPALVSRCRLCQVCNGASTSCIKPRSAQRVIPKCTRAYNALLPLRQPQPHRGAPAGSRPPLPAAADWPPSSAAPAASPPPAAHKTAQTPSGTGAVRHRQPGAAQGRAPRRAWWSGARACCRRRHHRRQPPLLQHMARRRRWPAS